MQGTKLRPMQSLKANVSYLLGGWNSVQFKDPIPNKFGDKHPARCMCLDLPAQ
jgi:hypothetical protein